MSQRYDRRTVLKGAGAAGMVGIAGCTDLGGGSGRTIKQGVLMPITGDLGSLGKLIRDGGTLPKKQLENADTKFSYDVSVQDTETSPQAGIAAANTLVNNGYPAITGPASSGVNMQVSKQVFIPKETVGCSPSSTSTEVTKLDDNDYVWRTCPSDFLQGKIIARVAAERLDASTAATLYVNNSYGQVLSREFKQNFSGTVKNTVSFEKEQSSYTSQLEKALGNNPDALVVIGYPASGIQLFRDYYSDFDTGEDIIVSDGLISDSLPKDVDNEMKNVTGTAPAANGPGKKFFQKRYKEEYDKSPGVFNAHAYDATATCILANVAGGENKGKAVRDNMQKVANPKGEKFGPSKLADAVAAVDAGDDINFVGAATDIAFDDNGDIKAGGYGVYKFSKEGVKQVDTLTVTQSS